MKRKKKRKKKGKKGEGGGGTNVPITCRKVICSIVDPGQGDRIENEGQYFRMESSKSRRLSEVKIRPIWLVALIDTSENNTLRCMIEKR